MWWWRSEGGGYSLLSRRTGAPVARLRPTDDPAKVQVLWWNGERWKAPGPFGTTTMTLDQALDYIASERAFLDPRLILQHPQKWPNSR